eukprot:scaffold165673_cov83-Cyclotella_meneghiniana.AAC.2
MKTTRGIDDSMETAIQQMKAAAQGVQHEFDSLLDMITAGILDSDDEEDEDINVTARSGAEG